MAKFSDRRCHWVFIDSRGEGLQTKIDMANAGEYLGVRMRKGATLLQLSRMAGAHLEKYPFDVVYVAGGACDITTKCQATKSVSFSWESLEDLYGHLSSMLNQEDKFMKKNYPASKIVFCPLVGIDLVRVVTAHRATPQQQQVVNEAIFAFNAEVFKLNKKRGTYSPSLHRTIHRSNGTTQKSHYHHLVYGLHLSEEQLTKWANEMVKASRNN